MNPMAKPEDRRGTGEKRTCEASLKALAVGIGCRIAAPIVVYRRWHRKRAVEQLFENWVELFAEDPPRTPARYARFEFLIFGDNLVYRDEKSGR